MPCPLRRRVLRGCVSGFSPSSLAFAWPDRRGTLLSLAGSHLDAAGCTSCYGLLVCSSCAEGYAASAPSIAQGHWAPAPWLSGDDHGWTSTSEQTVTCKAHQAHVRRSLEVILLYAAATSARTRRHFP